eukprot:GHVT01054242.1.p1 GENE.GHVT01054242.1~~GHVT01054242.1.p1  ORF type:complete len:539 (+),score=85.51 GHVT01054242.1:5170-6786(+)
MEAHSTHSDSNEHGKSNILPISLPNDLQGTPQNLSNSAEEQSLPANVTERPVLQAPIELSPAPLDSSSETGLTVSASRIDIAKPTPADEPNDSIGPLILEVECAPTTIQHPPLSGDEAAWSAGQVAEAKAAAEINIPKYESDILMQGGADDMMSGANKTSSDLVAAGLEGSFDAPDPGTPSADQNVNVDVVISTTGHLEHTGTDIPATVSDQLSLDKGVPNVSPSTKMKVEAVTSEVVRSGESNAEVSEEVGRNERQSAAVHIDTVTEKVTLTIAVPDNESKAAGVSEEAVSNNDALAVCEKGQLAEKHVQDSNAEGPTQNARGGSPSLSAGLEEESEPVDTPSNVSSLVLPDSLSAPLTRAALPGSPWLLGLAEVVTDGYGQRPESESGANKEAPEAEEPTKIMSSEASYDTGVEMQQSQHASPESNHGAETTMPLYHNISSPPSDAPPPTGEVVSEAGINSTTDHSGADPRPPPESPSTAGAADVMEEANSSTDSSQHTERPLVVNTLISELSAEEDTLPAAPPKPHPPPQEQNHP